VSNIDKLAKKKKIKQRLRDAQRSQATTFSG